MKRHRGEWMPPRAFWHLVPYRANVFARNGESWKLAEDRKLWRLHAELAAKGMRGYGLWHKLAHRMDRTPSACATRIQTLRTVRARAGKVPGAVRSGRRRASGRSKGRTT